MSNEYLLNLQKSHEKSRKIFISDKMKQYLISEQLSLEEKRMSFLVRNCMCDVNSNYRTDYKNNMRCRLCDTSEDSELHILACVEILDDSTKSIAQN